MVLMMDIEYYGFDDGYRNTNIMVLMMDIEIRKEVLNAIKYIRKEL